MFPYDFRSRQPPADGFLYDAKGALQLGLCISGQTSAQLLRRLRNNLVSGRPREENVQFMIGVNDFLQGIPLTKLTMWLKKDNNKIIIYI
uniref:Uncharacterized protein n=1 Tax=Timema monikensis TaxID=170555 RepID=A0A7R9ENB1_9NEOP|nr:unnamed protein product [Timema monikensis]